MNRELGDIPPQTQATYWVGLLIVALSYVVLYAYFLASNDYLPFVTDNGESFSSLWHAANLYHFGFGTTFGVTDEAYGFEAAAHPYVYTHQGNFPRLFAFAIYALGARSIQAQIIVSTFVIGGLSVLLAYHFFARCVTPLFAAIACIVMVTDYVVIGQWQVVTYRVWHEFFVFAAALCAHGAGRAKFPWKTTTVAVFAALFYYEFVFVAFVTLSTALYVLAIHWKDWKTIRTFWSLQALGGAIALAVLAVQLVLYLGWNDFLTDAKYTFLARNYFRGDPEALATMREFFDSRNIVFWLNLEDGSAFRKLDFFAASLTHYEFQPHTPVFTATVLMPLFALGLGWLGASKRFVAVFAYFEDVARGVLSVMLMVPVLASAILIVVLAVHQTQWGGWQDSLPTHALLIGGVSFFLIPTGWMCVQAWRTSSGLGSRTSEIAAGRLTAAVMLLAIAAWVLPHESANPIWFGRYSTSFMVVIGAFVLIGTGATSRRVFALRLCSAHITLLVVLWFVAVFLMACALMSGTLVFGIRDEARLLETIRRLPIPTMAGLAMVVTVAGVVFFKYAERTGFLTSRDRACLLRLRVALFAVASSLFLVLQYKLFNQKYAVLWREIQTTALPMTALQYSMPLLSFAVSLAIVVRGPQAAVPELEARRIWRWFAFVGAGLAGYTVVYMLSPGYIYTGYRYRNAPFTAFHLAAVSAMAVYALLVLVKPTGLGLALLQWKRRKWAARDSTIRGTGQISAIRASAFALSGLVVWYWFAMQVVYTKLLPADNYKFLDTLTRPPYAGSGFIVNTYAAPVAAATGVWAYMHERSTWDSFPMRDGIVEIKKDPTYLWFADKHSNPAYDRPRYFLCVVAPSLPRVAAQLERKRGVDSPSDGCETKQIVRLARDVDGQSSQPRLRLTEIDEEGPGKVGYSRWAVVRLDW